VVDVFGAWGASALPLLKHAAADWGKRYDLLPSRAVPLALAALAVRLAGGVAKLLLANANSDSFSRGVSAEPVTMTEAPLADRRGLVPD
jgi:hypothetical protein